MERTEVITIVESLANAFQSKDVVRALAAAAELLRDPSVAVAAAPAARRNRPTSAGARWSEQEDTLLCHAFDSGTAIAEIARQHARTPGAITARLVKLGRLDPETVKFRDRGATLQ